MASRNMVDSSSAASSSMPPPVAVPAGPNKKFAVTPALDSAVLPASCNQDFLEDFLDSSLDYSLLWADFAIDASMFDEDLLLPDVFQETANTSSRSGGSTAGTPTASSNALDPDKLPKLLKRRLGKLDNPAPEEIEQKLNFIR